MPWLRALGMVFGEGAVVGGGGATTGVVTGGAGITATEIISAGIFVGEVAVVGLSVKGWVDDYLDTPVSDTEIDNILDRAGEKSKERRRELDKCTTGCIWCQINIQAQGTLIDPPGKRASIQGIGPYLVEGRTVFAREGVIVAGATHEFVKGKTGRRNFNQIEDWEILAKTIQYILSKPPGGLPPNISGRGEYRIPAPDNINKKARYDIMVHGNINAFME